MKIIFCSEPFAPRRVDSAYEEEAEAAETGGFEIELLDFETLTREENSARAARFIKSAERPETVIYRGWMMSPVIYTKLYENLRSKNLLLINSPEEYKNCHYLPENYEIIKDFTPRTVFMKVDESFDLEQIGEKIKTFGARPVIVKDFVKSRKHEWLEACYIPDASDTLHVKKVVARFLELQGEDLNEGLAFREFVEFQPLAAHSKSSMPLTREYRLFFANGRKIFSSEYWEEGDYAENDLPESLFESAAKNIRSNFFTIDAAKTVRGDWQIVEIGDGQVSGLPENADVSLFYKNIHQSLGA